MAIDTATLKARIRKCYDCEQRWNSRKWPWPRCAAAGMDKEGLPALQLDDAAMQSEKPICPLKYWDGLPPFDEEKETAEEKERFEKQVTDWAQDPMLAMLTDEQAVQAMEAYVEGGHMSPEFAAALLKEAKGIEDGDGDAKVAGGG